MEFLKKGLESWATNIRNTKTRKKKFLEAKLSKLLEAKRDDNNLAELIDTKINLYMVFEKEERYWEQKARLNWLKLRDRNTGFFHSQATQRQRKNKIRMLQKANGRVTGDFQEMEEITRSYIQKLFSSENQVNLEFLLSSIDRCIHEEENKKLMASFTGEEIREVLFAMAPTKAPRENGFPALFYQKCLHFIGKDIVTFCPQLLNGDMEVRSINTTHIVLIPKNSHPVSMSHFTPISLCSVIYKIMAKAIANRFKGVINKCIDSAQSAFVPRRLISDNVLLAYEILHSLKQKRVGKKGYVAVKVDMSKAYDRVEWNFIEKIMYKMGFARS